MLLTPAVSVVIPYYNRAHCIKRAVDSALRQSLSPMEIIIVDDGSTDDLNLALGPVASRVTVIRADANQGAAAARNIGIRAATSDFVAFLDSDDWWHPQKLRLQFDFMHRLSLNASCTAAQTVLESDQIVQRRRPYPEILTADDFAWGCYVSPGTTLVVRREKLLEIGGYDERFRRFEDWDMLLRLARVESDGIGFSPTTLSSISKGSSFKTMHAHQGLEQIAARHLSTGIQRTNEYTRRLRAGVAFNRAALYKVDKRWGLMSKELMKCFAIHPKDNWPLKVILRDSIARRSAKGQIASRNVN